MGGRRTIEVTAALAVFCVACGPAEPPVAAGPASPLADAREFASCQWGEVRGAGLAIGAFTCGPDQMNSRLVADDALPGFALHLDAPDGPVRIPAVQAFPKPPEASLDAVLPAVQAASPGVFTHACALVPAQPVEGQPGDRFVLEPTGAAKAAWEASVVSDEPMEAPCGVLGVSIAGDRYFRVMPDDPTTVVFVELGSEIQIYDPQTLRTLSAS